MSFLLNDAVDFEQLILQPRDIFAEQESPQSSRFWTYSLAESSTSTISAD
jgi:hypothetical protein